jgi:hypothetical protein
MNFFVMNAVLVPPKHFFPIFRLLLWFAFGNIAFREGYEDVRTWNTVERKHNPVEGRHRWLAVAIIATESFLTYKYRYGTGNLVLDAETPAYIWVPWAIVIGICFFFWVYLRFFKANPTKKFLEPEEAKKLKESLSKESEGPSKKTPSAQKNQPKKKTQ